MAVLTGRSGQLYVGSTRVARCTGWSLDEQRPMLESTPLDSWDRTVVPGRRSGTGSAKLLYDPDDAAAGAFFDSILLDTKNEVPISLLLNSLTGESYPATVHVTSASHAVAKGEAQMRDISFKLSDISVELQIIGSTEAANGATQLYTGAVYGLSGAWTFLWTSSGPTIADPTSQSTNITFPDLGTFTLTLTATLGTTVLTDTLTIEVIALPLMWVARTASAMQSTGAQAVGCTCIDEVNQLVYHVIVSYPDVSVSTPSVTLSKFNFTGVRLDVKRLDGLIGAADACQHIEVLSGGDLFIAFVGSGSGQWMRVSADLGSITWQVRSVTGPGIQPTEPYSMAYDPSTNRMFFSRMGFNEIGYIDLATGVATEITMTMDAPFSPTNKGGTLLLQSGKVLFSAVSSASLALIECNNDLRVGGIFAPVKTVEHIWSLIVNSSFLVETDNYIASLNFALSGGCQIHLFDKSDYSHVKTVNYGGGSGDILTAYYAGGQFAVAHTFGAGWRIFRVSEDLTTQLSDDLIFSTATPAGPPWANDAPSLNLSSFQSAQASNGCSPGLGVIATSVVQRNTGLTNAEMCVFYRVEYAADYILDYGTYYMTMNDDAAARTETLLTPVATFNRAYSFLGTSVNLGTSAVSISNETDLAFQTYILAAP